MNRLSDATRRAYERPYKPKHYRCLKFIFFLGLDRKKSNELSSRDDCGVAIGAHLERIGVKLTKFTKKTSRLGALVEGP